MAWVKERRAGFLVCWRDADRKERSRLVHTREEADTLKAELEREAKARRLLATVPGIPGWDDDAEAGATSAVDDGMAFADYLRGVIDRDRSLRPSSRATYAHPIRNHIDGTPLGRADVRAIQPENIVEFWAKLDGGPGTLRNVRQLLSKGFNAAIREGIRDDNPMTRAAIRAPAKVRQTEVIPLTVDEVERLADATIRERDRLIILVMAYGGLRAGEVGGLRVEDVDVERCRFNLRQQAIYARGEGTVLAPLKTRSARRTVPIPCSVVEELAAFVGDRTGLVFTRLDGEPMAHVAINHVIQRAAGRAGIRPIHSHLLRHTAVSLLIDDGANPRAIQAFVGHANITETLGTYGHLFDYGGQALADSLERRREAHRNGG
jgi:integrase